MGSKTSPQRWKKVKTVFDHALEWEARFRPTYLDEAGGDDEALRAEVESLLAAHEAEPDFLEVSVIHGAAAVELRGPDPLERRLLGPYRLLRRIASGGMGAVYLSNRADQAYRKQVAFKLLRSDRFLDEPVRREELLRRFRVQRQTLANLDHPNIARLIDGGADDDRMPYLVMDYIEAQPIDQYCDARRLPILERLKLFRTVCAAVHYAHQHLVIHRDLKPSNILVTRDGVPKLLDFGIAKLLEADYPAAAELYRDALAIRRELFGEEHAKLAPSLNGLAASLYARGDYPVAEQTYEAALVLTRKLHGDEHLDVATVLNNLGALKQMRGQYAEAERLSREALTRQRQLRGDEHTTIAGGMNNLAHLLYLRREYAASAGMFREVLDMTRKLLGDQHPDVVQTLQALATLLCDNGDYVAAEPLLTESYAGLQSARGRRDPLSRRALDRVIELDEAWGKSEEAAKWRAEHEPAAETGAADEATEVDGTGEETGP